MKDLGKALLEKLDDIIDLWVKAVRVDIEINSNKDLTYEAVHNGLPDVLESVATLLTHTLTDENQELQTDALEHGSVRADQGFDVAEVVREYRILRNVVILALQPELEGGSVADALTAVQQIDSVLDEVVLLSLKSYTAHRLSILERMQAQLLLTNQELSRLAEAQKNNISHLAHELKNPLNSIISFSSILLKKQQKQLSEKSDTPLGVNGGARLYFYGVFARSFAAVAMQIKTTVLRV